MNSSKNLESWIARARALLDELEQAQGAPAAAYASETLGDWFARWEEDRTRRGLGCDEGRFRKWIAPRLGSRPVAAIRRDELEAWVEWIEGRVAAGELAGTTAWRVWTTLSSMMRDAWGARSKALRVRSDNPLRDVRPPERGRARVGTFLYPSEFTRLMLCSSVWLRTRRRIALAVYLYPRASELAALRWSDIDLRTGRIHIHAGRSGGTKTGEDRQFVAEAPILELLRAMRKEEPRAKFVIRGATTAGALRKALKKAGCKRADLYASDERRRPITFHDLRATGITWQAMRGDSPALISERVGHLHLATTEQYMRRGRLMALARGERVFPDLPRALFRG